MAQDWTDDVFAGGHVAQTDLQNIENNFAAIKSAFSGAVTPADTVAGMWWYDTTANILKLRNEANSAWLSVWDFANNKPVIANLSGEITLAMMHADQTDPAAGVAGLRTLGTGAAQALPGNTTLGLSNFTAASTLYEIARAFGFHTDIDTSYERTYISLRAPAAGTICIRIGHAAPIGGNTNHFMKIYKNGGAVGTERSDAAIVSNVLPWSFYDQSLVAAVGDIFEIYAKGSNVNLGMFHSIQFLVDNPQDLPAVPDNYGTLDVNLTDGLYYGVP